MNTNFDAAMSEIVTAIKAAGYEPLEQLFGYVSSGNEEYITRTANAREKIKTLNMLQVKQYVERMKTEGRANEKEDHKHRR